MKKEKGITLIALIITIVVLLILAVVAINAVTGDGIIQHAVNAKEEYGIAQNKETIQLALNEWKLLKYNPGNTKTFVGFMEEKLEDSAVTSIDEKSVKVTLENGTNYKATADGEIIELIVFFWKDTVNNANTIYTFNAEKGMTWEEFGKSSYRICKDSNNVSYEIVISGNNIHFQKVGYAGTGIIGSCNINEEIIENNTYSLNSWLD